MKLETIKQGTKIAFNRVGLKVKEKSPEILLGVGIVSIVGGTVMACKATLKAEEVLNERDEMMNAIAEAGQLEEYTAEDEQKDLVIVKAKTIINFTKLYAPAALLIGTGIVCVCASHGIMRKRNAALTVAYNAVQTAFNNYRARVVEELGAVKDAEFYTGKKAREEDAVDPETGEVTKQIVLSDLPEGLSPYAACFDEKSREWKKSADYNLMFLRSQQNWFNVLLQEQGHVFLNEVYDALDLPRTSIGALVGWVKGEGDNFIDFGLYAVDREPVREFLNGNERSVWLDFNVSGYVYDKI